MTRIRAFAALFAVLGLLAGPVAAPASAQGDNAAVAVNDKDGTSIFKFAFSIKRVTDDVVDNSNAAVAFASCDSCEAVAIAIQIVLVASDPDVVSPENLAIAINENCNLCETFAGAYQFVLGGGVRLQFTPEGFQRLAELRSDFRDLGKEDLTPEELAARLDELVAELRDVLSTELRELPGGPEDEEAAGEETEEEATDTETTETTEPPPTTTESTPAGTETTEPTARRRPRRPPPSPPPRRHEARGTSVGAARRRGLRLRRGGEHRAVGDGREPGRRA